MFKIGICTEREDFASYAEDLLGGMLCGQDEWQIKRIAVADLLDRQQGAYPDYHMFCLDEQLLRAYGMRPITYLSRMRPQASVILLEGLEEKGITGIRYHLFAYQVKRMKQQDLKTELTRQWQRANFVPHSLVVEVEGKRILIPIEQIVYIESRNRRVILHTLQGDYEYYEKLYELEKLLKKDDFVRCQQSYMVAKRFVTNYDSRKVWLDQISISIGRKYKEEFYRAFRTESYILPNEEPEGRATEKQGVLTCVKGTSSGAVLYFRPEQKIFIGRDGTVADIIVRQPKVSRLHCVVIFHEKENTYEVMDVSKNGTYLSGGQRLVPDTTYCVKAGTEISFGDLDTVYRLG
ncbi:MAG: LytTR family transcriptional regulator DNA-binding domain-containing protein [Clostridium sp.]|nr:LytTR family transcriptional regulator DNA-binding domain-containing protein [Clostridium sp.]